MTRVDFFYSSLLTIALTFATFSAAYTQITDIRSHDPVMIEEDGRYYIFHTGQGISVMTSTNMKDWNRSAPVFAEPPTWAMEAVPGFKGHIWAPDIYFHNDTYYLYYSISAFGKNTSAIGLATNTTLNSESADFEWIDHGKVIQSVPGRDLWNAIDPNLVIDDEGTPWLSFGSFWNGIKLIKMADDLRKPAEPQEWYTIASRERDWQQQDSLPGEGSVEAPFIFKKDGYYYLFVSYDYCCRGPESTYKIVVARAENVRGPYLDKNGDAMRNGAATLVLEGNAHWHGVGHNATYTFNGSDFIVFHGYDAKDEGKPKLQIKTLEWKDGWPEVSGDVK